MLLTIITRTFESLICTEPNDINSFLWIPVERLRVDDNGGRKIFEKTFKNAKIKFTDNIRNKEKTHSHKESSIRLVTNPTSVTAQKFL